MKCRYCGIGVVGDYPVCDAYECGEKDNKVEHKPEGWKVVVSTEEQVTIVASCSCGEGSCAWSATVYADNWIYDDRKN